MFSFPAKLRRRSEELLQETRDKSHFPSQCTDFFCSRAKLAPKQRDLDSTIKGLEQKHIDASTCPLPVGMVTGATLGVYLSALKARICIVPMFVTSGFTGNPEDLCLVRRIGGEGSRSQNRQGDRKISIPYMPDQRRRKWN